MANEEILSSIDLKFDKAIQDIEWQTQIEWTTAEQALAKVSESLGTKTHRSIKKLGPATK